jgi:hypothetical protein
LSAKRDELAEADVVDLAHDGRGIARASGKAEASRVPPARRYSSTARCRASACATA